MKERAFLTDFDGNRVWVAKGDTIFFKDDIEMTGTVAGIDSHNVIHTTSDHYGDHVAWDKEFEILAVNENDMIRNFGK